MATLTDTSLANLLRALRVSDGDVDASRLIRSASSLLTGLTNPLNVTLLTDHILSAPAIWIKAKTLQTPLQVISAFTSATSQHQAKLPKPSSSPAELSREEWTDAVTQALNDHSTKWKHLLVLCGLLLGFKRNAVGSRPRSSARNIEMSFVRVVNIILLNEEERDWWSTHVIPLTVGNIFHYLGREAKARLHHELLLPVVVKSAFFSDAALDYGYFLSAIDIDIVQDEGNKFSWRSDSLTYRQTQYLSTSPLVGLLGPLSQLAVYSLGTIGIPEVLDAVTLDLLTFCKSLDIQWRQNKLSEIDAGEEDRFLVEETQSHTLPVLWHLLQSVGFAVVVILRSLVEALMTRIIMPQPTVSAIATRSLHTLRCLHFVILRMGHTSFSAYNFIYTACVDILSGFPRETEKMLCEMRPTEPQRIPEHPQERCYDLFFLNLGEQLSQILSPTLCEELLIAAANPYLEGKNDIRLSETFEAAHSTFLAVLVAPQCAQLTFKYISYYLLILFQAFPHTLSAQQLGMAVRLLAQIRIDMPHNSGVGSSLAPAIMDILQQRFDDASHEPVSAGPKQDMSENKPLVSERAALLLAMVDILPFLDIVELREWLSKTISNLDGICNVIDLRDCCARFWAILNDGEMDFERAAMCSKWWNTEGGKHDLFLQDHIRKSRESTMHGLIVRSEKL